MTEAVVRNAPWPLPFRWAPVQRFCSLPLNGVGSLSRDDWSVVQTGTRWEGKYNRHVPAQWSWNTLMTFLQFPGSIRLIASPAMGAPESPTSGR